MAPITRRDFLKYSGLTAAMLALSACAGRRRLPAPPQATAVPPPAPALTPTARPPGPAETAAAARLLRRITFGLRPEELERALAIGYDNYIDEQLAFATLPDPGMDAILGSFPTLDAEPASLQARDDRRTPAEELTRAAFLRAVYSKRQLYEMMVDFWTNHFNINLRKGEITYLKPRDDRDVIRKHALGKFADLLSASAHSPAMLLSLDNQASSKKSPNENYARELLELHTLGVDGGYTQEDVRAACRVLTGWGSGNKNKGFGEFVFNAGNHDTGAKTILGQVYPQGKGQEEGDRLLQQLTGHPSTARYIAFKLVRRFVADDPPPGLVEKAAAAFTRTRGDIPAVMSVILHSNEMKQSAGQKLKRPLEWIVSALRALDAETTADRSTLGFLSILGQPLFLWTAPNGYPDTAAAWLSTNGLLGRWNFSLALAFNTLKDSPVDLSKLAGRQTDPQVGLDRLSQRLLGEAMPAAEADIVRAYARGADPAALLPGITALILSSPAFMYR